MNMWTRMYSRSMIFGMKKARPRRRKRDKEPQHFHGSKTFNLWAMVISIGTLALTFLIAGIVLFVLGSQDGGHGFFYVIGGVTLVLSVILVIVLVIRFRLMKKQIGRRRRFIALNAAEEAAEKAAAENDAKERRNGDTTDEEANHHAREEKHHKKRHRKHHGHEHKHEKHDEDKHRKHHHHDHVEDYLQEQRHDWDEMANEWENEESEDNNGNQDAVTKKEREGNGAVVVNVEKVVHIEDCNAINCKQIDKEEKRLSQTDVERTKDAEAKQPEENREDRTNQGCS